MAFRRGSQASMRSRQARATSTGAATASIPPANEIGDDLAVGELDVRPRGIHQ